MADVKLVEAKTSWEWSDISQGDVVILNGLRICIATVIPTSEEIILVELADGDIWEKDEATTITKILPKNNVSITVKRG